MVQPDLDGVLRPTQSFSTSKCYPASTQLKELFGVDAWQKNTRTEIGAHLLPELFWFKREVTGDEEGKEHLERNLLKPMPWIVTSAAPLLTAAQVNTQVEFDRTFRTIVKDNSYRGKNVVYLAGLNIDISPQPGQLFPLTKFVPWAAYIQEVNGHHYTLEQAELMDRLKAQSDENPDQIDLEKAITEMRLADEIRIALAAH
jgi:hypothetical protein